MADQEAIQVTVILANVKQFRDKFYRLLSQQLAMHGVALRVVYSEPNSREALKGDCIDLAPDLGVKVPGYYFLGGRVLLQLPRPRDLISAKLIIVVQAAGYLLNYPLLLLSLCRLKKVAYWGHGWNRQGNPSSFAERSKRLLTKWCTWWFAYTDDTKARLTSLGFDPRRITVIENAIDTRGFRLDLDQVTAEELNAARSRHLLAESDCVALYCGSLYEEKRLTFLLDAAREISRSVSGFRLLIVGAGPGVAEIIRAQKEMPETLRYAGAMF
jgi:glycosyltransferase involved in cell wall biosynthesis